MSTENARKKSKMGRPSVDSEELRARVERNVIVALESYADAEQLTRPQAIRTILADWLRTHGFKISDQTPAQGPATDAVAAMDKAINDHKTKRKK